MFKQRMIENPGNMTSNQRNATNRSTLVHELSHSFENDSKHNISLNNASLNMSTSMPTSKRGSSKPRPIGGGDKLAKFYQVA